MIGRDWWVTRRGRPVLHGEANSRGHLTHREARTLALEWTREGWTVKMLRRTDGVVVKELAPRFPEVERAS